MLALAVSGCASHNMQKWSLNSPAFGSKAVPGKPIVFGTIEPTVDSWGMGSVRGQVIFELQDPDPNDVGTAGVRKYFHLRQNYELTATKPGRYTLSSFAAQQESTSYDFAKWRNDRNNRYGTFEVRESEVIYVGHLVIDPDGEVLKMRVDDRFEQFKQTLPPNLANRIQKRLILFPATYAFPHGQWKSYKR